MSEKVSSKYSHRLNPIVSCECGCGKEFKQFDSKYRKRSRIVGHQRVGRKNSDYQKEVVSRIMTGPNNHQWNPNRKLVGRFGQNFSKKQIKTLRKDECIWCYGKRNLALDHIIPVFIGGTNINSNAQTLCMKCNNVKRDIDYRIYGKQKRPNSVNAEMPIPNQAVLVVRTEGVETKRPPSEKSEDIVQTVNS